MTFKEYIKTPKDKSDCGCDKCKEKRKKNKDLLEVSGVTDIVSSKGAAPDLVFSDQGKGVHLTTDNMPSSEESTKELPHDRMKNIQSNIKKGASDETQMWYNALELVHRAYVVSGVQRPLPDMADAWKQYESNIEYAVKSLSDSRGKNGQWRMTGTGGKKSSCISRSRSTKSIAAGV